LALSVEKFIQMNVRPSGILKFSLGLNLRAPLNGEGGQGDAGERGESGMSGNRRSNKTNFYIVGLHYFLTLTNNML
jgi:hypothetical protein